MTNLDDLRDLVIDKYMNESYGYNLGIAVAKKWSARHTDAQIISMIKKGRQEDGWFKDSLKLVWEIWYNVFRYSKEHGYAVDKYEDHIKATAIRYFGKRRLYGCFGVLPDDKLVKEVLELVYDGDSINDAYPFDNIDYGFQDVMLERLKRIGQKLREQKRKQKIAATKKMYAKKTAKRIKSYPRRK